ncbi:response regulator transcription factor [Brooklawnia cerclae]|uniref:DNA-binding NarL/FixJ family response regulator n=1 Tax=Brooklawnia cerclae TaxID=349934 RepID=A0ABX0SFK6_9ACTN|nr:response regulator transcription factor [Brooklawnia cerclae]NIH57169.1 DNA-binding NarL/FixJ family response regulator [Brooklawnia cerclae]
MIRVLIVDDQEMIRTGLRTIIDAHPDLEVVAETGDALAALKMLGTTEIDVVLMDIRMPGIDGVEATRRIRRSYSAEQIRILVLTTFDQDENVLAAVRAGADGFFSKGASPAELTAGILRVAGGGRALSPAAVDALVDHVAEDSAVPSDPSVAARFTSLTPRELEIVQAIVTGLTNEQIAADLYLSPFTVKTHANRAMMKVGARDRAQLVSLAVLAGIHP